MLHRLGRATGIAERVGEPELAAHLDILTTAILDAPQEGDLLPRGMGAEIAVGLEQVLRAELAIPDLTEDVTVARECAIALELERTRRENAA